MTYPMSCASDLSETRIHPGVPARPLRRTLSDVPTSIRALPPIEQHKALLAAVLAAFLSGCASAPAPLPARPAVDATPVLRGPFSRFGDIEDMECKTQSVAAAFVAEGRDRGWSLTQSMDAADAELARLHALDPVRYQAVERTRASLAAIAARAFGWPLLTPSTVLFAYFPLCQGEKMGATTETEANAFLAEALVCQGRHAMPRAIAAIRLEPTEEQKRALRECVYRAVTPLLTQ